ncbi:uncharacterized protein [Drosophila bipectinata]|uniref:uncharacterized protein n=1 Tax=Drosophila bipectinata TaxID=42026 RepID=UPI0007E6B2FA|nr:ras-related protein RIC1-like [Drosophila bipectinata]
MFRPQYNFKIIVVGDSDVGKSCILMRFAAGRFSGQNNSTVGIDFKVRSVELGGTSVNLQIWDTAGEERFRSLIPSYYRRAHGILLVYDLTSLESLRNLDEWLSEIGRYCPKGVCVMMVGNKCDDLDNRRVSQAQGIDFAARRGLGFREVSAKSGMNIADAVLSLALDIYNTRILEPPVAQCLLPQPGWDASINIEDEEAKYDGPEHWRRLREDRSAIRLTGGTDQRIQNFNSCC